MAGVYCKGLGRNAGAANVSEYTGTPYVAVIVDAMSNPYTDKNFVRGLVAACLILALSGCATVEPADPLDDASPQYEVEKMPRHHRDARCDRAFRRGDHFRGDSPRPLSALAIIQPVLHKPRRRRSGRCG